MNWYLDRHVSGLFANCGSSDMFILAREEAEKLVALAVKIAAGRVPVVATGSIGPDEASHPDFSRRLQDLGVDAVILLHPPEFCPDEPAMEHYCLRIASALRVPLGIYECPGGGRKRLSPELVGRLARTGRFVAYKETSGRLDLVRQKMELSRGTPLKMLQANLPILRDVLKLGGAGIMGLIVNCLPGLTARFVDEVQAGHDAETLWRKLNIGEALHRAAGPYGMRYLLKLQGLPIHLALRREASPMDDETALMVQTVLKAILEGTA